MIHIQFNIENPWGTRFNPLGSIGGKFFTKNKAWELEHYYNANSIFDLEFMYTTRRDHAGLRVMVGLLGYCIGATIYDVRHWNYLTKQYEKETI
jgi:hypothetical protein